MLEGSGRTSSIRLVHTRRYEWSTLDGTDTTNSMKNGDDLSTVRRRNTESIEGSCVADHAAFRSRRCQCGILRPNKQHKRVRASRTLGFTSASIAFVFTNTDNPFIVTSNRGDDDTPTRPKCESLCAGRGNRRA